MIAAALGTWVAAISICGAVNCVQTERPLVFGDGEATHGIESLFGSSVAFSASHPVSEFSLMMLIGINESVIYASNYECNCNPRILTDRVEGFVYRSEFSRFLIGEQKASVCQSCRLFAEKVLGVPGIKLIIYRKSGLYPLGRQFSDIDCLENYGDIKGLNNISAFCEGCLYPRPRLPISSHQLVS